MAIYEYKADLVNIVDGDTQDIDVDLGFYTSKEIRVRLEGVDTHETYGVKKDSDEYKKGMKEKEFVEDFYESADELTIKTMKDSQGKYGRWLARVWADGQCLNELLIENFDNVEY